MQVFHIATECTGIASVGGLGDVVHQVAKQCALSGFDTTIILPRYGRLDDGFEARFGERLRHALRTAPVHPVRLWFPGKSDPGPQDTEMARFAEIALPAAGAAVRLCLVDSPRFARRSSPYGRPDYPDVYPINLLLQKAALTYIGARVSPKVPAVVHGHDAHVATLALAACRGFPFSGTLNHLTYVFTAHNLGWGLRQRLWMDNVGWETNFLAHALDVAPEEIRSCIVDDGIHAMPGFEPFAAAALHGDHLTVVSEGYLWELMQAGTSETAESDMEIRTLAVFLERHRRAGTLRATLSGITNGIDPEEAGPEAIDAAVRPEGIACGDFDWKQPFQAAFRHRLQSPAIRPAYWDRIASVTGSLDGFHPDRGVLFTYVGRLDAQKGADILARAVEEVFPYRDAAALCLLGAGRSSRFDEIAGRFPGRVVLLDGRSEEVAREVFAAGDFLLMPSRFEPCGLADLRAQLNGNIPVVNQVGGLSKIVNGQTGIGFFGLGDRSILRGLVDAMHRAADLHANPEARIRLMRQADAWARQTATWEKVFPAYQERYLQRPRPRD
jgi:starch synthase